MEKEGLWVVRKKILGWLFNGATRCVDITDTEKQQAALLQDPAHDLKVQEGRALQAV